MDTVYFLKNNLLCLTPLPPSTWISVCCSCRLYISLGQSIELPQNHSSHPHCNHLDFFFPLSFPSFFCIGTNITSWNLPRSDPHALWIQNDSTKWKERSRCHSERGFFPPLSPKSLISSPETLGPGKCLST